MWQKANISLNPRQMKYEQRQNGLQRQPFLCLQGRLNMNKRGFWGDMVFLLHIRGCMRYDTVYTVFIHSEPIKMTW